MDIGRPHLTPTDLNYFFMLELWDKRKLAPTKHFYTYTKILSLNKGTTFWVLILSARRWIFINLHCQTNIAI